MGVNSLSGMEATPPEPRRADTGVATGSRKVDRSAAALVSEGGVGVDGHSRVFFLFLLRGPSYI